MKRKFAVALLAIAILAGTGVGLAVAHDNKTAPQARTDAAVRIIDFRTGPQKVPLFIDTVAKVSKLKGTSAAFQQFVSAQVSSMIAKHACPGSTHTVSVDKYATSGFALGGISDCGGHLSLWGVRDGSWRELVGTQDMLYCGDLQKYRFPAGLLDDGQCYNQQTRKVQRYAG